MNNTENKQNLSPKNQEEPQKEKQNPPTNKSVWLLLFVLTGIKELLEFVSGLTVVLSVIIWPISLLTGILIIIILFMSGKLKDRKNLTTLLGHLADMFPVINTIPFSFLSLFVLYLLEAKQNKTVQKKLAPST